MCAVPTKWRECISCRPCKRALVLYLGECFVKIAVATCMLRCQQKLVVAGCLSGNLEDCALAVGVNGVHPLPELRCEPDEADTRVWLHLLWSEGTCKLVCSPDTDVYHIGLPLVACQLCEVYVRISVFSSLEHRYLSLSTLCTALTNDPDLASVPRDILPRLLQILFISTGCDYISYFSGLGKCTFLKVFFQHAEFINSISLGTLCDTCSDSRLFFVLCETSRDSVF